MGGNLLRGKQNEVAGEKREKHNDGRNGISKTFSGLFQVLLLFFLHQF